ncbi:hypothetical protein [Methylocystis suflitae]|uniref:hypothetical protein n=1 Tax=Methylocystis suflitae TaxID=2951405 RepID=UPI00210BB54A|nr:hypothetical protein [Methylocystis suflitae]MCQ4190400.1 hypothetical protein [Methylocystis suflitae]
MLRDALRLREQRENPARMSRATRVGPIRTPYLIDIALSLLRLRRKRETRGLL